MEELKEMIECVKKIVPKNWHIIPLGQKMVLKPNAFNILLWVYPGPEPEDEEEWEEWFENGFVGCVKGPIHFTPISVWREAYPEAEEATEKYGDRLVARIEMQLIKEWLGIDTFIHELAHIAVVRWHAQRLGKRHRDEITLVGQDAEKEQHGPMFQKAYERLIVRAEKILGKNALKHNRADLKMYKERYLTG
jgi:hypothetical protein